MPPIFFNPPPFPLLLLLISTASASVSAADPLAFQSELETMAEALRIHGSTLFTNAIATTDLQYQLLAAAAAASSPAFTIFAPKDSLLYALDMISDSFTYTSTLRYHFIPNRRHTFLHLQNLSSPFLDTLLSHYSVLVGKTRESEDILLDDDDKNTTAGISVMVDGVRVTSPDLFLGDTIAVHGIDGILVTGLNMYQDFDLDPGPVSLSYLPPPPSPAESPAAFDATDTARTTTDHYTSAPPFSTWPAESPASPVVFDDTDARMKDDGMGPPVFSDHDQLDYWNSNNGWTGGGGGGGNMMLGDVDDDRVIDGNWEKKNKNVNGKRKRAKRRNQKRRRLRVGGHRRQQQFLDL